jgi:hypothetical protein
MSSVTQRSVDALAVRLRNALAQDRAALMTTTHIAEFRDNLVESLLPEQITALERQLKHGDGRELDPGPNGEPPDACSIRSSAVLALNAFGRWLGDEKHMSIAGISGFDQPLEVEKKLPIQRGGRPPNLDVLLAGPGIVVGVESKLLEPLSRHGSRTWQESYSRAHNLALLGGGWRSTLDAAIAGKYSTEYLDVGQLLRHALGLNKCYADRSRHLVYCYWEPTNGGEVTEVVAHRSEVAEFADRVSGSEPSFHAVTYAELLDEWSELREPAWLEGHISALRERYEVQI